MEPVVPALVARDADAHHLLSQSLPARIDRYFHDKPPPADDRAGNPRLIALSANPSQSLRAKMAETELAWLIAASVSA